MEDDDDMHTCALTHTSTSHSLFLLRLPSVCVFLYYYYMSFIKVENYVHIIIESESFPWSLKNEKKTHIHTLASFILFLFKQPPTDLGWFFLSYFLRDVTMMMALSNTFSLSHSFKYSTIYMFISLSPHLHLFYLLYLYYITLKKKG